MREKDIDPGEDFEGAVHQIMDNVAERLASFHESIKHLSPLGQECAWLAYRESRVVHAREIGTPDFLVQNAQRLVDKSKARIRELLAEEGV